MEMDCRRRSASASSNCRPRDSTVAGAVSTGVRTGAGLAVVESEERTAVNLCRKGLTSVLDPRWQAPVARY